MFYNNWNIKLEYQNEVLMYRTKAFTIYFDVPNTPNTEWEYYYNNGFEYAFEEIII